MQTECDERESKETVRAFLTEVTKKIWPEKKIRYRRERKFLGILKTFAKLKEQKFYSTMSETKAAFAERTI